MHSQSELMRDGRFLDTETRRYNKIIKQANQRWGGAEQRTGNSRDIWSDDEVEIVQTRDRPTRSSGAGGRQAYKMRR